MSGLTFRGVRFKAADLWVGAYWEETWLDPAGRRRRIDLFVCLLPMVPLWFQWYRSHVTRPEGASRKYDAF